MKVFAGVFFLCVLFLAGIPTVAAAVTADEALEKLIFNYLFFDFNDIFSAQNQAWRIDTFEDVEKIPMKLFLSGATSVSESSFSAYVSQSHLTASDYNNLKNRYSADQIIYIFKSPGDGSFIGIAAGIHSAPPTRPADFSGSVDEWNSLYNWPCNGCGRIGHSHTDTAFCMYSYMGIERADAEYKIEAASDHPGMQVYSVHIPSAADWWYSTGAEWQALVESSKSSFNCHNCICAGPAHEHTRTRSDGSTYTVHHCCDSRSDTREEYMVSFSPAAIMHPGTTWDSNNEIKSDNYVAKAGQIHWLDRTPPEIRDFTSYTQATDGNLPTADATDGSRVIRCSSGDYRKLSLKFYDENIWANSIACSIAFSPASWTSDPGNSGDNRFRFTRFANNSFVSQSGRGLPPNAILLPGHVYGTVEYSVYAWDGSNNLNPSDSFVADNEPANCYGVCAPGSGRQHNNVSGYDLLTDPLTAKPFPFMAPQDMPSQDQPIESPLLPQETGFVRVYDNDLPNIMISIVNLKDKQKSQEDPSVKYNVCFPPPAGINPVALWKAADYESFKLGLEFNYEDLLATETVYFMPLDVSYGETGADSDAYTAIFANTDSWIKDKILNNPESSQSYFRRICSIEDYTVSDTVQSSGNLITEIDDADDLRKRLGYGRNLDVLTLYPLEEDVEYEISVWVQDNSRYVRNDGGRMPEAVSDAITSAPGSGIKELVISCKNGAQVEFEPAISSVEAWNKSVHGPYRVVFKDPSAKVFDQTAVPDLISLSNQNPSIQVSAKDVAGNQRTLRLFFQIQDQKARIRTLEQRHMR